VFDALLDRDPVAPVLLVDAIDRADPSFEAMLAEILDSPTLTIPENGSTVKPGEAVVVVTANGSRPASDTLRRHSLYAWLGFPPFEREIEIVSGRIPGISRGLAGQLCNFVEILRNEPFVRRPGIAETIDWASALTTLRKVALDPALADQTIGCVLKDPADIDHFRRRRLASRLRPVMDLAG
jgi:MoxR-like ATPase